ncbi:hypothetical protein [uncultured Ruthenibacterium sp.]|uniref:hypothetical protein n=1 Tax=uncultured Ruthenibacterium sp. TaxID=1905347 RepID=UPI00349E5A82
MEEQINQTQPEGELFEWGEAGQGEQPPESEAPEAPEAHEGPEAPEGPEGPEEGTLTVKYRGKEQAIPMSKAKTLAQKGMAFDEVSRRLDAALPAYKLVDEQARAAGLSVDEYVARATGQPNARAQRQRQFAELLTLYPEAVGAEGRLPAQVMESVVKGESPVHAYERYALSLYRMGEGARRAHEHNRASVPGSAQGLGNGPAQDPFTAGWDSVD